MKRKAGALLAIVLLAACAQVREITGGDADKVGPVLKGADPANYTTRFTGDRITLHFDEDVQIERARDRMLVSPPLDVAPTVRVTHAHDVEISLNAPLRANTTYTFSMGEVVKDLTEGNYAAGMDYVISTGDALDSLHVHGVVADAFSEKREKGILVMLYSAGDTSNFRHSRPLYATRTDTAGSFDLKHVGAGTYNVVALQDQNANYRYDLPNETIGFVDAPVIAGHDSAAKPVMVRMFQEKSAEQTLRDAAVLEDGAWRMILARPAEHFAIKDLERSGSATTWNIEWSATRDTVLVWPSDTTALADGRYEIATEEGPLDTLRYRAIRKMPFFTRLDASVREDPEGVVMHLKSTRPLAAIDRERLQLQQDSVAVDFTAQLDSLDKRHLVVRPQLAPGANAQLTLLPKAVRDIYDGHNDTLRFGIGRSAEKRTGTLRVTVEMADVLTTDLIVQLLDMQGGLVREAKIRGGGTLNWEHLTPGNHTLRLIVDANGNGRWDTGAWKTGFQPEFVLHYKEVLNLRAAWDLGIAWKLVFPGSTP